MAEMVGYRLGLRSQAYQLQGVTNDRNSPYSTWL